jgi:enamine deaminase RidA (YjgF/YER057c/UK114 family)
MSIDARLNDLGIELPNPPIPKVHYITHRQVGDLLFLTGVVGTTNGEQIYRGKVGGEVSLDDAYQAARLCGLNHLTIIKSALGSLDRVECFVKMTGYINAAPGFLEMPKVLNGASDLFTEVFGDAGAHVRAAIGIAEIGNLHPVETDLVVQVKP